MFTNTAQINLERYDQNIQSIRSQIPTHTKILAVVKANAYGLGAVPIAKQAIKSGCSHLGVMTETEGIELRKSGIKIPILILAEPPLTTIKKVIRYQLTPSVTSLKFATKLNKAANQLNTKIPIHIETDTGISRNGYFIDETFKLIQVIRRTLPNLILEGVFSHFSESEKESKYNKFQLDQFNILIKKCEKSDIIFPIKHMANSAGTLRIKKSHFDMVRIGLAAYQNTVKVTSFVHFIKHVPKNTSISYNQTYITSRDTTIAVVQFGYADGYPSELSNKGMVEINQKHYPIRGKVCMDMLMIDLGKNTDKVKVGDEVTIISNKNNRPDSLETISKKSKRNPREILCGLGKRVIRKYS